MTAPSLVYSRAMFDSMSATPSKYAMSCFTMAFHATNRSMRRSDGRRSCGATFFLISDCALERVEGVFEMRDTDVARETDAASWLNMAVTDVIGFLLWKWIIMRVTFLSRHAFFFLAYVDDRNRQNERGLAEHRRLPGRHAGSVFNRIQLLDANVDAFLVARRIPFDDPVVLNYVRLGYITSQIIILGTYFYISYKARWLLFVGAVVLNCETDQAKKRPDCSEIRCVALCLL